MSELFKALNALDVNDKTEKKNGLTYLSWAWAWAEFKKKCPDATYEIVKFGEEGRPYFCDERTGYMVYTRVTAEGITYEMWLPVMDYKNKAMQVGQCTMFDINKAIMRCLTKNLAMFGLGLYIYAGEDLPEAPIGEAPVLIDAEMQRYVEEMIEKSGADMAKLLKHYKVERISDMDYDKARDCIAGCEKKIKFKEEHKDA